MTAVLQPLPEQDETVKVVPMLTPSQAVDLYLGDCQRRGLARRTITRYQQTLYKFADTLPDHYDVKDIRPDDCRRYLDRLNGPGYTQGYRALEYSALYRFHAWLESQDRIRRNPMGKIERPRRVPPDELDVTTVSTEDVLRLLAAAQTWAERLAINLLVYMGPRKRAAALLRLRDYDRERRMIRFREKGGKTIWKPVPDELASLLDAAIGAEVIQHEDDYLIPAEGPLARVGDRDDRVIWRLVKRVGDRAGVVTHVHALRAAFAVFYLEQPGADIEALKDLMGHRSTTTTQVYLRRLDRAARMESVRGLSWRAVAAAGGLGEDERPIVPQVARSRPGWPLGQAPAASSPQQVSAGFAFDASAVVGAGGFEPPKAEEPHPDRAGALHTEDRLDDALTARVREHNERSADVSR